MFPTDLLKKKNWSCFITKKQKEKDTGNYISYIVSTKAPIYTQWFFSMYFPVSKRDECNEFQIAQKYNQS